VGRSGCGCCYRRCRRGAALERAFSGAEGVYALLPPNFSSSRVRVDNNPPRANTIAAAVEAAGVSHVVLLSSVGAQQSDGTGPVLGLRNAETIFSRAKAAVTFVRAAYLMENWGGSLYALEQSVLPTFLVAEKAIPSLRRGTSVPPLRACSARAGAANGSSSWRARASTHRAMSLQPSSESSENRSTCSRRPRRRWHLPSWAQA
jgi:uncharacterized protein YbjT (DUF2867 family)